MFQTCDSSWFIHYLWPRFLVFQFLIRGALSPVYHLYSAAQYYIYGNPQKDRKVKTTYRSDKSLLSIVYFEATIFTHWCPLWLWSVEGIWVADPYPHHARSRPQSCRRFCSFRPSRGHAFWQSPPGRPGDCWDEWWIGQPEVQRFKPYIAIVNFHAFRHPNSSQPGG